ncbi:acetylxylan esterase [Streptomyces sp. NPDC048496]
MGRLRDYRPESGEPADFDAFRKRTLDESAAYSLDLQLPSYDAA